MRTIAAGLLSHLSGTSKTMATCWIVTRRDKQTFRFTDHDRDLVVEGQTFAASSGYRRTALSSSATMAVSSMELDGVIGSTSITEQDVRAGLWDYAEVWVFAVNWADTTQGTVKLQRGRLGEVTVQDTGRYLVELRGLTQPLSQSKGELYSPECRAEVGDKRCRAPIEPAVIGRSAVYTAGTYVRVPLTGPTPTVAIPIVNGGFETGSTTGWTITGPVLSLVSSVDTTLPQAGSYFLRGGANSELVAQQDVTLSSFLTTSKIDSGDYIITVGGWRCNAGLDLLDLGQLQILLLDGSGAVLTTLLDTGPEMVGGAWVYRGIASVPVTAGARTLRIVFSTQAETTIIGQNNASLDSVAGFVTDLASMPLSSVFGGLIYKCTTAGTTAATQPTYGTTAGNTTTDGTAVFTAALAYTVAGMVNTAVSRSSFTVTSSYLNQARAGTGWFDGGYVVFENGNNAGVAREVLSWDSSTRTAVLFQPMPFAIAPGDAFRIAPGCDRKAATCKAKFDNFINFRGEPLIPGVDEYMKVGGRF